MITIYDKLNHLPKTNPFTRDNPVCCAASEAKCPPFGSTGRALEARMQEHLRQGEASHHRTHCPAETGFLDGAEADHLWAKGFEEEKEH